jgi:cytochrome oxidase Cu insertion factor (SCO1/SenC/PrrC family)
VILEPARICRTVSRRERARFSAPAWSVVLLLPAPGWIAAPPLDATSSMVVQLAKLRSYNGATELDAIASCLAEMRRLGRQDAIAASEAISAALDESAVLYQGRSRDEVIIVRGLLFLTLAELGPPPAALPAIVAELEHGHDAFSYAAAARAAAALGRRAAPAVSGLERALSLAIVNESVSLGDYRQRQPLQAPTTPTREAFRALASMGPGARHALDLLRGIAGGMTSIPPNLRDHMHAESVRTIAAIESACVASACDCCCQASRVNSRCATATAWLAPNDRRQVLDGLEVEDHSGSQWALPKCLGRPVFLTFFYTRCDNPLKCPRAVSRTGELQHALAQAGLATNVQVMLITFDPAYDDATRLRNYACAHGLRLDNRTTVGRLSTRDLRALCDRLRVPVSFNAGWVTLHGLHATLLDKSGRPARQYNTVLWDNQDVVKDLQALVREPGPSPSLTPGKNSAHTHTDPARRQRERDQFTDPARDSTK